MIMLQTKIQFAARKKLSVKKNYDEKENSLKSKLLSSPVKSPSKLGNNERDERFLLKVNSPVKRNGSANSINSASSS